MNGAKLEHIIGRFIVRTEWRGRTLVYDVLNSAGLLVAYGLDVLSPDEETAIKGIAARIMRRSNL